MNAPLSLLALGLATLLSPRMSHGQSVADHLECFRIKDPVNLKGVVDLDSPQFGPDSGCKIMRAQLFCVPVSKTVKQAADKAKKKPIRPLAVSGPGLGDHICYKIRCPEAVLPDQEVTDQFGTRT